MGAEVIGGRFMNRPYAPVFCSAVRRGESRFARSGAFSYYWESSLSTAINASVDSYTVPSERIFFLPRFCFSSSFFFRVISPQ